MMLVNQSISETELSSSSGMTWNRLVASFPDPHILQSWEWGQVKARFGWLPYYLVWFNEKEKIQIITDVAGITREDQSEPLAASLVLQRSTPIRGINIVYLPKGPLLRDWNDSKNRLHLLEELAKFGREHGAIFIKMDPDVRTGTGLPNDAGAVEYITGSTVIDDLLRNGWRFSSEQVQFRNTVLLDLAGDEEALLMRMKQKFRYNVRLAKKKGVSIRLGEIGDLDLLYSLYTETAKRDGFVIRERGYYKHLWRTFFSDGEPFKESIQPTAMPLIAEVSGEPVAAMFLFLFAGKAWFLFGMSGDAHREKMPNYLLQWEAIRLAKTAGCHTYDLWGAPDTFEEDDPLWGVYRFKEGMGGEVVRHIGAWDLPLKPFLYRAYTQILPRILTIMRRREKSRIQGTPSL